MTGPLTPDTLRRIDAYWRAMVHDNPRGHGRTEAADAPAGFLNDRWGIRRAVARPQAPTRHGKIAAKLASFGFEDVPIESFHYTDRSGTGLFAGTTGEGELTVGTAPSIGKGASSGTITSHFLTTNEG